jgi:hypothetical protein
VTLDPVKLMSLKFVRLNWPCVNFRDPVVLQSLHPIVIGAEGPRPRGNEKVESGFDSYDKSSTLEVSVAVGLPLGMRFLETDEIAIVGEADCLRTRLLWRRNSWCSSVCP